MGHTARLRVGSLLVGRHGTPAHRCMEETAVKMGAAMGHTARLRAGSCVHAQARKTGDAAAVSYSGSVHVWQNMG